MSRSRVLVRRLLWAAAVMALSSAGGLARAAEDEQGAAKCAPGIEGCADASAGSAGEEPKTREGSDVTVSAGSDGLSVQTEDKTFRLKLRGYVQADARFFLGDSEETVADSFLMRRVRPDLQGTLHGVDFRLMPDFGLGQTVLQDAYLGTKFLPELGVQVGKFKAPFGLERLQSATALRFIERALPTQLVPNRDIGLQLGGVFFGDRLEYAAGVFNGVPNGGSTEGDTNDAKDLVGRVFARPFKGADSVLRGIGVGLAASWGIHAGTATSPDLPTLRTAGQQSFFRFASGTGAGATAVADGALVRLSPQASIDVGPFGLVAEYAWTRQAVSRGEAIERVRQISWQVAPSVVLFGGDASFEGISPEHPHTLGKGGGGGWGALELAARYSELSTSENAFPALADPASSARRARAAAGGANWYVNQHLKLAATYERTWFVGGAEGGDRAPENLLAGRFQIAW